jgi:hypothetical protein
MVVVFALQNVAPVMVTFLGWSFEGPIAFIVIVAALVGVIISMLFSVSTFFRGMMAESKLNNNNHALRKELDESKAELAHVHAKIAQGGKMVSYTTEETTTTV